MGKLYVGNLPWSTTEEQLKQHFSSIGTVGAVRIVTDKTTGRSKGFAFVEVENADRAIAELDNTDFSGRPLRVSEARERDSSSPRQGGGGYAPRQDRGGYAPREDRGYSSQGRSDY